MVRRSSFDDLEQASHSPLDRSSCSPRFAPISPMTTALSLPSSPHIRGASPSAVRLEQVVAARLSNPIVPSGRRRMFLYLAGLIAFVVLALALQFLYTVLHEIDENGEAQLVLPTSIENVKRVHALLMAYTDTHFIAVVLGISVLYVLMLTFAIPGTVFLSILCGALFHLWWGIVMCVVLATAGSSCCYFMSSTFGSSAILRAFPTAVSKLRRRIDNNRDSLLWYLLFLRMTPLVPNTVLSLIAPFVGIRYSTFAIATSVGLLPSHYLCVRSGTILSQLASTSDIFDLPTLIGMFSVACLALLPIVFKKRLEKVL